MNGLRKGSGAWARRAVAVVAVAAAAGANGNASAGEPLSITRVYGAGVHAYFSGDYQRSYDDLTDTIEAGSIDPRARYFRGLAALALGRFDEAEADFSKGALLEAQPGGNWPVSWSLERVQGHQRFQLERHRARARVAILERIHSTERERRLEIQGAQPDVRRDRRPAALPSGPAEPSNPFAEESGTGSAPAGKSVPSEPMPPPAAQEPPPTLPGVGNEAAAPEADLKSELEPPAGDSTGGAAEGTAPTAPAGDENPFGDKTSEPAAGGE